METNDRADDITLQGMIRFFSEQKMDCTRPDYCYVKSVLCSFLENWLRELRYLRKYHDDISVLQNGFYEFMADKIKREIKNSVNK